VHAPFGLIPAFTTKTFPNFWTIATGLYEESHGMIDNSFLDPNFNESFSLFNKKVVSEAKWWKGEPIWVTAKRQGKSTAVFFWPGSEVQNYKWKPDLWRRYDSRVDLREIIETVLNWLQIENINLAMMYYNQPDKSVHKFGTFHTKVRQMVEFLDRVLYYLFAELQRRDLLHKINILIVSDHGMTDLKVNDENALIYLSDYIDIENDIIDIPESTAVAAILPKPDKVEKVYQSLKYANKHMKVYLKEKIPERFHYKHNDRIMPIIAIADEGYFIFRKPRKEPLNLKIGQHGYDN
ncbi:ectonucleotide pyrophosphatase/phosphodiesterase family member 5-like protein, partial [Leptotrombidium deliense]